MTTPLITNLALDPFERFHEARCFDEWQENRSWTLAPALGLVNQFFESFTDYPPRQESFVIDVSAMVNQIMTPSNEFPGRFGAACRELSKSPEQGGLSDHSLF